MKRVRLSLTTQIQGQLQSNEKDSRKIAFLNNFNDISCNITQQRINNKLRDTSTVFAENVKYTIKSVGLHYFYFWISLLFF